MLNIQIVPTSEPILEGQTVQHIETKELGILIPDATAKELFRVYFKSNYSNGFITTPFDENWQTVSFFVTSEDDDIRPTDVALLNWGTPDTTPFGKESYRFGTVFQHIPKTFIHLENQFENQSKCSIHKYKNAEWFKVLASNNSRLKTAKLDAASILKIIDKNIKRVSDLEFTFRLRTNNETFFIGYSDSYEFCKKRITDNIEWIAKIEPNEIGRCEQNVLKYSEKDLKRAYTDAYSKFYLATKNSDSNFDEDCDRDFNDFIKQL